MVNEPIISVVVPVYNAESYLDGCIQSILDQTIDCYELILVDDGSVDKSGVICDTWAIDDERIRVIHSPNGGAAKARNIGAAAAKGNYVTFVDADDTVTTDYLEYLYKLLCEYNADISIGGYEKIYPDEKGEKKYNDNDVISDKEVILSSGPLAMEMLLYQDGIMSVPWGMLIKKSILDVVHFPEGTKAEDMGTIYRLLAESKDVVIGKHAVYNYYQRISNTIFSTSNVRNIDYYKHSRKMIVFVKNNYPRFIMAAYNRHFSTCFQILSETKLFGENKKLVKKVYKDISLLQAKILKDKNARKQNRIAALLSLVSIRLVHMMLIVAYKVKLSAVKSMGEDDE